MNYIFKSRGLGKTSDIVRLCHANNGVILVAHEADKRYIRDCICPQLQIPPDEVRIEVWGHISRTIPPEIPIYIDEFQYMLEWVVGHKIEAISGTLD